MSDKTIAGLLITAITALAGAVGYLFRIYLNRNKEIVASEAAMQKERNDWVIERQRLASDGALERQRISAEFDLKEVELKADYEKKFRELVERYDAAARRDSERYREHENQVRKEFAEIMEKVESEAARSRDALVQVMQKLYDRFIGPRPGPRY